LPRSWDAVYFSQRPWSQRVGKWLAKHGSEGFSQGNRDVVERILIDPDTGLRMVVNISAASLLCVLEEGRYRNLYDRPMIGEERREPSPERLEVDGKLGITPTTYFGAVALGGTGVRFYGEYCMVIRRERVPPDTRLFDRDSYDIVLDPIKSLGLGPPQLRSVLGGRWASDVVPMAMLRVLPELGHESRLVTSGTVSEAVLRDQEFIEVHLDGSFGVDDIEEVRQSPDETSLELTIFERERHSLPNSLTELEWARRRADVARQLDAHGVRHRVVTLHGRGYQWK